MLKGFTLVELLVVISIMALLGVVAYANFKDFAQDQVVNKAIGQIQTAFRLAQANATSGVTCLDLGGADWSVQIRTDGTNVDLICGSSNSVVQTTILENVEVDSVGGSACAPGSTSALPLTVTYSKLSGTVKIDGSDNCIDNSATVSVNFKNLKTSNTKTFTISKGGAINVQ
ncbi:prepilin-type N-terminal cleavage/methylation domain-containing protein [Candidatus Daviesbacteria bacterium]|nr:prepilin-type N-terminal cleavage/methylation domain-containing protein [Candidatus Daviesbacteria bacterium]